MGQVQKLKSQSDHQSASQENETNQQNVLQRSSVLTFVKDQDLDCSVIESIIQTLNDKKYLILKSLGQGAFGMVFQAVNKDKKEVAIKILNAKKEESFESCKQEVDLLKSIDSPHVIKLFDSFIDEENKIYYIVTEYCPQNNLETYLKNHPHPVEESILKIFQGIILGLIDLHRKQIIHSDLKPSNILLDENNQAKICDFGLSILKENNKSLQQEKGHTPNYCAEEQILGAVGFLSDIYSAGIILRDLCYPKKMGMEFKPEDYFEDDCDFPEFVKLIKLMTHQKRKERIKLKDIMKKLDPSYQVDDIIPNDIPQIQSQQHPLPNLLPINKIESIFQGIKNEINKLTNEALQIQSEYFMNWEEDIKKNKGFSFKK